MGTPYIGEIRMFAGNFSPAGWLFCEGQLLPISENETLFQLIGTTYGGDGQETFGLPDLRGRLPVHMGGGYQLAETGGVESVSLTVTQIPAHTHAMIASTGTGTQLSPQGKVLASGSSISLYRPGAPAAPLNSAKVSPSGGSQPHDNMHPFLCINYIISLFGIFPSAN